MKYSFVIPVYNVEKYLAICIRSILSQSFSDFELILIDDGSKDKSGKICDQFADNDKRIKVIHKGNSGQADSRNIGTERASGEYIIYIDSDDFIMSDVFLEKINACLCEKPDVIFFKHKKFFDSDQRYQECAYSYKSACEKLDYADAIRELVVSDSFFGMPWNKAIKRELIIKSKIHFEKGLVGEDMEWIYHVILNAKTVAFVDEPFIAYRQREGSTTTILKYKNIADFVYILEKWKKEVEKEENLTLKEALLGSLAKYYSNLLVAYSRAQCQEKKRLKHRIKSLSELLKYGLSKRPILVGKVYRMFGFEITVAVLTIIDKIK